MKTKELNEVIQNVPYKEVTSGLYEEVELLCGKHIVVFSLDCDVVPTYYMSATRYNPEEFELKESKEVGNIKVFSDDYETEYQLNDMQKEKLSQEVTDNLKVVY